MSVVLSVSWGLTWYCTVFDKISTPVPREPRLSPLVSRHRPLSPFGDIYSAAYPPSTSPIFTTSPPTSVPYLPLSHLQKFLSHPLVPCFVVIIESDSSRFRKSSPTERLQHVTLKPSQPLPPSLLFPVMYFLLELPQVRPETRDRQTEQFTV